jgi:hypothetical protein
MGQTIQQRQMAVLAKCDAANEQKRIRDGMTQAKWNALTPRQRDEIRSDAGLTQQLKGLEGWRVEVVTTYGETRRFIVGRSTGWVPCHLEVPRRNSFGGMSADKEYRSVTPLYKAR